MMKNYKEKLHKVNTFIFDFDGVLSDGKMYVMGDGEQVRATNTKDGYALQYALRKGYHVAIISGGYAESMKLRYKNFPGMDIFLAVKNKIKQFREYLAMHDLQPENVLVMGDDIPDYQMMVMGCFIEDHGSGLPGKLLQDRLSLLLLCRQEALEAESSGRQT